MGRRGRYKYICEECKAENWLTTKDRQSHFKPKCIECGSPWLEASKGSKGPDKIAQAQEAARKNNDQIKKKMGKE